MAAVDGELQQQERCVHESLAAVSHAECCPALLHCPSRALAQVTDLCGASAHSVDNDGWQRAVAPAPRWLADVSHCCIFRTS
jgi:hypothetical protein